MRRTMPGAMRAPAAAARTPAGDATSERSARLKRHFDANSRRLAAASRACTPVHPCASASSAAAAASSAAADGKAQSVAGHRIDESGGVAREQQPLDVVAHDVDRERTEHDRVPDRRAAAEPVTQGRLRADRVAKQPRRIAEIAGPRRRSGQVAARPRQHQADVADASPDRRHPDVAAAADVHLAERRADRIVEVGADRPALRPGRVPREPQTERERGSPAIRGNHRPSRAADAGRRPSR